MHGFTWCDVRGTEGYGIVRTVRTLLTNHLFQVLPALSITLGAKFAQFYSQCPLVNGSVLYYFMEAEY
jgi:hypothetical protein